MSVTASFEITGWDETTYDAPEEGPPLKRVSVRKRFSGPLEGTSTAEVLIAGREAISPASAARPSTRTTTRARA